MYLINNPINANINPANAFLWMLLHQFLFLLPPGRALLVEKVSQKRAVKLRVSPQYLLSVRKLHHSYLFGF